MKKNSVYRCSDWAETYRVMGNPFPGPWTHKYHPWLEAMQDSECPVNVGQKAAQMGFSEHCLNTIFFNMDVKGHDCLYILPAKTPDASDFSSGRFDVALELSQHLSNFFSDVKNIGHKRAGSVNLYIRGSRSRAGLKSIPAAVIIFDEVEEMVQENIPLARERGAGQKTTLEWFISTPSIENYGINKLYRDTTQEHFFFKCPACSRLTELVYPDSLVITAEVHTDPRIKDSYYICKECNAKLNNDAKTEWLEHGIWVPAITEREARGFQIPQLYSSARAGRPENIAYTALLGEIDPATKQELYNSKLGLPHEEKGASVSDTELNNCIDTFSLGDINTLSPIRTMGIDVGLNLNIEVCEWYIENPGYDTTDLHMYAVPKVIWAEETRNWNDLPQLMLKYRVNAAVIDAQPERQKAFEFASRFPGNVKMCFYGRGISSKRIHISKDEREPTITVDRSTWLDLSLGRFHTQRIRLPKDIPASYRSQIKTPVRLVKKDKLGLATVVYVERGGAPDHYAHSRNYAEIALSIAFGHYHEDFTGNN